VPTLLLLASAAIVIIVVRWGQRELDFQHTQARIHDASLQLQAPDGDAAVLASLSRAQRLLTTFVQPSVVHIEGTRHRPRGGTTRSTGSGWIWDDNGHVVTAWHVVRGFDSIDVQLHDGSIRTARLVAADPLTDIAVLAVPAGRTIAATRAPYGDVQQGDLVFAFGSPLDFRFSVTSGVVSGLGREVGPAVWPGGPLYENSIQIDAPINPGSSGGPVTNHLGHVVGMSSAIAADPQDGGPERFSGVAMAIPIETVSAVVPQLLESGDVERGYLGVHVLDRHQPLRSLAPQHDRGNAGVVVDPGLGSLEIGDLVYEQAGDWYAAGLLSDAAPRLLPEDPSDSVRLLSLADPLHRLLSALHAPAHGVLVARALPGSAAEEAGVRRGDVITMLDGDEIGSVGQLRAAASARRPGSRLDLMYWRHPEHGDDDAAQTTTVHMGRRVGDR